MTSLDKVAEEIDQIYAKFNRHLCRCTFKVGDTVVFNRPKRPVNTWTVVSIEHDPLKVKWKNNKTPMYIRLTGQVPVGNGHKESRTVWTSENQLRMYKE